MITDDPGTVDKGHFEINFGFTTEQSSADALYESPLLDANFGVSGRQHVNFEVSYILRNSDFTETTGIGRLGIGSKFRFLDQDKAWIDISTHPDISFVLSHKAVDDGLVDDGTEVFIPFEFQKDFGPNIIGMEFGRLMNSKNEGAWTYGILYSRDLSKKVNAAVELNGAVNPGFNDTELFLNIGSRINLAKHFTLIGSAGRNIIIPEGSDTRYIAYLCIQIGI